MQFLADLWLPIVLSTVFVFLASWVLHMLLPLHRADFKGVSDEARLMEAVRAQNLAPGEYYFPWCATPKDMQSPDFVQKYTKGPVGHVTVMPSGPPSMGKSLLLWVVFTLVIGIFTAYVGSLALTPGADFTPVLRVTATVAMLGFAAAYAHNSIWKGTPWPTTFRFMFDGVVYALLMGATFAWLWPAI